MAIEPGSRFGPYQIVEKIGAGGMGEVFRARDTRLDREVAVKVLPAAFIKDAERVSRFEREAKSIAALSHPNVLAIFDTGRAGDDVLYVVTELLTGETLRDRLTEGPLSVRRAIEYGVQIAHGLAAAHDKGLVHRDLKPENVFLLADGHVKILDFGLARPVSVSAGSGATQTVAALTDPGMVMGTVGYMAPEQIRGQPIDGRSDVFAFGAVLYEMVTGTRAFARETAAETMTAILKDDPPDLTGTRPDITVGLDRIIRHCLEKNPAERFQSARDAAFALESLSSSGANTNAVESRPEVRRAAPLRVAAAIAAAAIIATLGWTAGRFGAIGPTTASSTITRLEIPVEPGPEFLGSNTVSFSFSPDGRTLYYVARRNGVAQVFRRPLDATSATPVSGTEGATSVFAFSDGRTLGFAGPNPTLRRISVEGGTATPLVARAPSAVLGVSETSDGQLLFGVHGGGIFRTRAGSEPELIVPAETFGPPRYPVALPGGAMLFTTGGVPKASRILVRPAGAMTSRVLTEGTDATYTASGHIAYWRDGGLWAAPLDVNRLELTGQPTPVVENLAVTGSGRAAFAISQDGTLAYVRAAQLASRTLVWVDKQGKETALPARPGPYLEPKLSPDGQKVLLAYRTDATEDIWMYDISRGVGEPFVAEAESEWASGWTPDGEHVLFTSRREGVFKLFRKRANGLGGIERTGLDSVAAIQGRTPNGRGVLISTPPEGVSLFDLATGAAAVLWQESVLDSQVSPNGQWIAYSTPGERGGGAGRGAGAGISVRPYPLVDADRWRISPGGGTSPRWSPDGQTLYYMESSRMMAVKLRPGPKFPHDEPVEIFSGPYLPDFDIASDGRFLMIKEPASQPRFDDHIVVVLNWFADLEAKLAKR